MNEDRKKLEDIIKVFKGVSLKDWQDIKKALDMYFSYKQNENAAKIKIDDIDELKRYFNFR